MNIFTFFFIHDKPFSFDRLFFIISPKRSLKQLLLGAFSAAYIANSHTISRPMVSVCTGHNTLVGALHSQGAKSRLILWTFSQATVVSLTGQTIVYPTSRLIQCWEIGRRIYGTDSVTAFWGIVGTFVPQFWIDALGKYIVQSWCASS